VSLYLGDAADRSEVVEILRQVKLEVTTNGTNGVTFVRCAG
jgi:hypothetical protein